MDTKKQMITADDIRALRSDARDAGNREMVKTCRDALCGDSRAWEACRNVILARRAS